MTSEINQIKFKNKYLILEKNTKLESEIADKLFDKLKDNQIL